MNTVINGAVLENPNGGVVRNPAANRVQIERALREKTGNHDEIVKLLSTVARVGECTSDDAKLMISHHEEWISGCNLYDSIRMATRRIRGDHPGYNAYVSLANEVLKVYECRKRFAAL